jgi:hypothetical protein
MFSGGAYHPGLDQDFATIQLYTNFSTNAEPLEKYVIRVFSTVGLTS